MLWVRIVSAPFSSIAHEVLVLSQRLRKAAQKKKRRKDILHQRKLEALRASSPAEIAKAEEHSSIVVYVRETMFPDTEMYSEEQKAAADAVIAAFSLDERNHVLDAAIKRAEWEDFVFKKAEEMFADEPRITAEHKKAAAEALAVQGIVSPPLAEPLARLRPR